MILIFGIEQDRDKAIKPKPGVTAWRLLLGTLTIAIGLIFSTSGCEGKVDKIVAYPTPISTLTQQESPKQVIDFTQVKDKQQSFNKNQVTPSPITKVILETTTPVISLKVSTQTKAEYPDIESPISVKDKIFLGQTEKATLYSPVCYYEVDFKEDQIGKAWEDFVRATLGNYFNRKWLKAVMKGEDIVSWLRNNDYKTPVTVTDASGKPISFKVLQSDHWGSGLWEPSVRSNISRGVVDWSSVRVLPVSADEYNNDPACRSLVDDLAGLNGGLKSATGWSGPYVDHVSFGQATHVAGLLFDRENRPVFLMMTPRLNTENVQNKWWVNQFGVWKLAERRQVYDTKLASAFWGNWIYSNIKYYSDGFGSGSGATDLASWQNDPGNAYWVEDVTNPIFEYTGQ